MMIMLTDELVIEVVDSPSAPPGWIETIDVENGEFQFCDGQGQRYVGEITRPVGFFRQGEFRLRPEGYPDIENVLVLIDKAKRIAPNDRFPDLGTLRNHVIQECRRRGDPRA